MRRAKTEFLKECIADALINLLKKKSLEDVSILEIAAKADVGRATFYRHFVSKEDVLYFKCTLLCERWYAELTPEIIHDPYAFAESFFERSQTNRDVLATLFRANQNYIVLRAVYYLVKLHWADQDEDEAYASAFLVHGLFGILSEQISRGYKKTPKELAALTIKNLQLCL